MIELRSLSEADKLIIFNWPSYPTDCIELDYAVRKGGWIDAFPNNEVNNLYSAYFENELIGFSGIHQADDNEAYFFIAIRGDKLGQGLGKQITIKTLSKCFKSSDYKQMNLFVRKNNKRAIKLYDKIGFINNGECILNIKGNDVEFYKMKVEKKAFLYD